MDALALRLANRLVGNGSDAPALEMTGIGAKLRFDADAVVAICGADMDARLIGEPLQPLQLWKPFEVWAGEILQFSAVKGAGTRTYLAVRGGVVSPKFLGSASTFMLGKFGGHAGRALRAGDVIHVGEVHGEADVVSLGEKTTPQYSRHWEIAVLYGPHTSPEFFTDSDIAMIFSTDWKVHYQSDRTGVRLVGPKPEWARKDGGEAGLHPSNIHDNAYAIGSIDFTGDMPILLGPDGPSAADGSAG
jgi:urea carboxylase